MSIQHLQSILCPSIIVDYDTLNNIAELKEDNTGTRNPKIEIHQFPEGSLIFKLDIDKSGFKKKSNYLGNPQGVAIHKACDYVIVTKVNDAGYILFCELKSKDTRGAQKQLLSTTPFIDYLTSLLKFHFDSDISNFMRSYFVFTTAKRFAKQPLRRSGFTKHSHQGIDINFTTKKRLYFDEMLRG